jgi:hypothetical protein
MTRRLDWFDELYRRKPKPPHVARLTGHDYRVVIVVEDELGNDTEEMGQGEKGVLRYAVVNESHRRTVEATFSSEATRGAMVFSDPAAHSPTGPVQCNITAYRKCNVEDQPVPYEDLMEVEVKNSKKPQEVFLTALTTKEEGTGKTKGKTEEHNVPLTNIVLMKRNSSTREFEEKSGMNNLTGAQYEQLTEAIVDAFNFSDLDMMLQFRLEKKLATIASPNDDIRVAIFKLIRKAQAEGWTERLITASRNYVPGNPKLLEFSRQFGLSSLRSELQQLDLERLVKQTNTFLNVNQWRTRLGEIEAQVCRIEIPTRGGVIYGTGFLVGSDVVMTNHHVMETVIAGRDSADDVILRFDYKALSDGRTLYAGTEYHLARRDWLIDNSPNNRPGTEPNKDELDYALLRVDGAPGNHAVGGQSEPNAPRRKWIKIPEKPYGFEPHTPLFIMQHPEAQPLKLAIDTDAVMDVNSNGTRIRYKTNTEGGSSGSPCFSSEWDLIALHHSGDPNFDPNHEPGYNEGIPLSAILELLETRNLTSLLGQ